MTKNERRIVLAAVYALGCEHVAARLEYCTDSERGHMIMQAIGELDVDLCMYESLWELLGRTPSRSDCSEFREGMFAALEMLTQPWGK